MKAAAAKGGFVPAASVRSLRAVATQGERQLTLLSRWLMTKMGCLKAFPNPRLRWWWWEQKMQHLLIRADLPSAEDSGHSPGTELGGGGNFQVPLTPEMLHAMAKASTPGSPLQRIPLTPCSKQLDFSPPICYSNPFILPGELLQGSASPS